MLIQYYGSQYRLADINAYIIKGQCKCDLMESDTNINYNIVIGVFIFM